MQFALENQLFPPSPALVSLTSWIDALHRSLHTSIDTSELNPAEKLLPFFEKLRRTAKEKSLLFHTEETARRSVTMARLGPVTNEWMELWMRQWETPRKER